MTWRRCFACASCLVVAMTFLCVAGCSSSSDAVKSTATDGKHPKAAGVPNPPSEKAIAAIAAAHGELVRPQQALVLELRRDPWQALAAACLTPAFYNSDYAVPLVLDDGSEKREVLIPHDAASVAGFGQTPRRPRPRSPRPIGRRPLAYSWSRPTSRRFGSCPARPSSRPPSLSNRTKPRSPPWAQRPRSSSARTNPP